MSLLRAVSKIILYILYFSQMHSALGMCFQRFFFFSFTFSGEIGSVFCKSNRKVPVMDSFPAWEKYATSHISCAVDFVFLQGLQAGATIYKNAWRMTWTEKPIWKRGRDMK